MGEEHYRPISCDNHDELEAAAVQKKEVVLEFERAGVQQRERGRITDVYSPLGAEWVRLQATNGQPEVRLDEFGRCARWGDFKSVIMNIPGEPVPRD
ncbi:MAG TPA: hypothetical protein VM557_02340 [Thermoanaerobaculia bacterium]|nr:hypothetical protein [Thermoanaerobaculia bacterium]